MVSVPRWPHHCYKWLTGAQMFNATAESIDGLQAKGRVDFVMINEAGIMPKAVPFSSIPRIKDKGGFGNPDGQPPNNQRSMDYGPAKKQRREEANKPFYWRFVHMLSSGNDHDTGTADQVAQMRRPGPENSQSRCRRIATADWRRRLA